ncbi:MAG TPA: MOSC N-terminal beta barrel domain-containing protein, partial [Burkholderiaceae bacterium]|nr:MOSC N-terminal beta barrel domain-containing protein [Burkholderiaceae bacterium]
MALRVSRLFVHPVKSCAGIEVERARLLAGGLELDRQWMIVDRSGRFVTQRSQPRLALLRPRTSDGQLTLSAPDGSQLVEPLQGGDRGPRVDVRIWGRTVPAHDCGDGAAAWLGRALGGPCRLVRRPAQRADSFADAAPILLLGQESLDALNRRLRASGAAEAGIERFRPNLVIAGADAFDEDHWHTVESTQWALGVTERCERCEVPNID